MSKRPSLPKKILASVHSTLIVDSVNWKKHGSQFKDLPTSTKCWISTSVVSSNIADLLMFICLYGWLTLLVFLMSKIVKAQPRSQPLWITIYHQQTKEMGWHYYSRKESPGLKPRHLARYDESPNSQLHEKMQTEKRKLKGVPVQYTFLLPW